MVVRIGKGDGFSNEHTKKLHDVGTRAMNNTKLCIHENVTEFDEENCLRLLNLSFTAVFHFFAYGMR